jgi:hypothetical protein
MAKKNLINNARGSRGVRGTDGVLVMIDPGQTASVDVDAQELKDVKALGITVAGAKADDDDGGEGNDGNEGNGPLDGSITQLKEHLETVDSIEDLDALGTAEAAGKARAGALDAIQARRDAIEAAV